MRFALGCIFVATVFVFGVAYADVASTFDTPDHGWTASNDTSVTYVASGGNPGGYLQHEEAEDQGQVLIFAPEAFLGPWRDDYEGGSIRFDHALFNAVPGDSGYYLPYRIRLYGPTDTVEWTGPTPTEETDWQRFYVPLRESAWTVVFGSWDGLLDNVTNFVIAIEVVAGADTDGIDNVLLRGPAPIIVAPDGSGDFPTIQAAIDSAFVGDVIELTDGTFRGDGNRNLDPRGKAITIRSASGDPWSCVIDCEGSESDQQRGFYIHSGEPPETIIEGIGIINAYINNGGAISCRTGATPTIRNCLFAYNYAEDRGGGMFVLSPPALLENCEFYNNTAGSGGGIHFDSGVTTALDHCVFNGNTAAYGGGLHGTSGVTVSASYCTFYGNSGTTSGGAIRLYDSQLTMENSIIAFGPVGYPVTCEGSSTATLSCCDVYGNVDGDYESCIYGQEGVRDNISADPLFCDAAGHDLTLAVSSPCLTDPCGQIGALGQGCFAEWPFITSITDVGNDQGRQVRISWQRSDYDVPEDDLEITGYGIYRRQDEYLRDAGGGPKLEAARKDSPEGLRGAGWDYLATVPARGDSVYQYVAPTLCDSTLTDGICWSVFFVSAMTPDPLVFFDSPPDSGYSVDNLAPEPPANLRWEEAALLAWDEAEVEDFDYFTVYGSESEEFDETAEVLGYTIETSMDVTDEIHAYYHVTASDFSGNEGEASSIEADVNAVEETSRLPLSFALWPVRPNPFAAEAVVSFDLPVETTMRLRVFDLGGRLVATLLDGSKEAGRHNVIWDGRQGNGSPVGPGVYFVKMEASKYESMRRIIRLR